MNPQTPETMISHMHLPAECLHGVERARRSGWFGSLVRSLAISLTGIATLLLPPLTVQGGVPEPDAVVFGAIALDGRFIKATDTSIVVELRATTNGPVIASYRMGSSPRAGDRYVLRVSTEDLAPILQNDTVALGSTVQLSVRDGSGLRDQAFLSITNRAQFIRFDFGDVDTDGDGMSDRFELQYFGSATGGNPNADPDGDGRPNFREALQGTNPLKADGRHPADIAPADDSLTIKEVTDYALAWQTGSKWSIEPTNIPIAYVTRAGALWKGGERYGFDNDPVTNAPNWWVNVLAPLTSPPPSPVPTLAENGSANSAWSDVVSRYSNGVPFTVKAQVKASDGVKVYAVEDLVPEGWLVRNISSGGRLDRGNRKVKWGPFFDSSTRELSYQLIPTSESNQAIQLVGLASFDGSDLVVQGARWLTATEPAARLGLSIAADGKVQFTLQGVPGLAYRVEQSSDLNHWEVLRTVALVEASGNIFAWTEDSLGNARYFRGIPTSRGGSNSAGQ